MWLLCFSQELCSLGLFVLCFHISQAEGLEQSFSTSLLLEVSAFPEESSLSRELMFVFPADVVEGSERVLVTAVGM